MCLLCNYRTEKRGLVVDKIQSDENWYKAIGKTARVWQGLALEKASKAPEDDRETFRDLGRISKLIAECMENPEECFQIYDRIYICSDIAFKNLQALSVTKNIKVGEKKYLKVSHIVTHPNNIRSTINDEA